MIEVEKLTKQYGAVRAVDNVSFTVDGGEILGFLGPNAAGKTTTLRMLTCFIPPTSGTARVGGYDVFQESMQVRKKIGYLPEHVPLYLDMRVTDYLDFVAKVKGIGARERSDKLQATIGRCGLDNMKSRIIGTLSKGYRQRVGIAQALLGDPDVLLLDEPTTGLDPRQITEIRELIKELGQGHTVILSTHILPEVSMICDRVIIINEGEIVALDSVENLTRKLTKSQMTQLNIKGESARILETLKSIPGVLAVDKKHEVEIADGGASFVVHSRLDADVRENVARAIVEGGFGLHEMKAYTLSLEDIFLTLTGDKKTKKKGTGRFN